MMETKEQLVQKLTRQKDEFEEILSKILFPILITSKETRKIVYANPYAQKQYEIELDALIGMEVAEFYTNDEQREKIISSLKDDGTVENLEMHWKTAKGNTFYGLLSLTSIHFNDEECFMGMVKDITLQKEQDARLARQSKMEAIGELISVVAHHWRQPLNTITVTASGLVFQEELGMLENEELVKSLSTIEEEAKYLSQTIDDFHNLIDDAKGHKSVKFSLNSTIEATLSINNYPFETILSLDEDIELKGIANKLVQTLTFILQNSLDVFETKMIEKRIVKISTKILQNNQVSINILDNGGGIDEKIIDKVFEPYFTTAHQSKGKGLSLYKAMKMIQDDLDGSISVENSILTTNNENYEGAMFCITVPYAT